MQQVYRTDPSKQSISRNSSASEPPLSSSGQGEELEATIRAAQRERSQELQTLRRNALRYTSYAMSFGTILGSSQGLLDGSFIQAVTGALGIALLFGGAAAVIGAAWCISAWNAFRNNGNTLDTLYAGT